MCSNTSHTERGQHSSNLRLHRRMGCLKMPENEEQTFAMVEAMGESIHPHILQGFGPQNVPFSRTCCRLSGTVAQTPWD